MCLTQDEFWEKKVTELNVPVTWIGNWRSKLARVVALVKVLRRNPPDVLQSQHFYTNLYVAAAARMLGISEIAALRNDGISEVQANGALLGRLSLRVPRMLVANSQAAIRNAIALGVPNLRLHLLANVVDTAQFKPALREPKPAVTLVTAGRLVEQKRIDRFLRIVMNIKQHSQFPIKAIIVGDGPLRSQLERQAAQMNLLPQVVEFRGTTKDMVGIYKEADIFVLTSDFEGTPNVVLEAMSCGLPVVATQVGGVSEIIMPDETGSLADAGDEVQLTNNLLNLVQHAERRIEMGVNARNYILANHSPMRLPSRLAEIYEVALS
jgi:glycosyltransferase involved in cell wall biosynthesis